MGSSSALTQHRPERARGGFVIGQKQARTVFLDQIDGVLTVMTTVVDGVVNCDYVIVETVEDLIACQGSKYHKVRFAKQALPKLREYDGRVAVVGLPCDCTVLKRICEREPDMKAKVKLVLALVCGHNSEPELTAHVVKKLGKGRGKLVDYSYRSGHWRGELTATYENGDVVKKPFKYFSNLNPAGHWSTMKKKMHCSEKHPCSCPWFRKRPMQKGCLFLPKTVFTN